MRMCASQDLNKIIFTQSTLVHAADLVKGRRRSRSNDDLVTLSACRVLVLLTYFDAFLTQFP